MKKFFIRILAIPLTIYFLLAERHFYIVLTGIDHHTNRRMWARTILKTRGNILPIYQIEKTAIEKLGWETCIVTSFFKVSNFMLSTFDKDVVLGQEDSIETK